VEYLHTDALGSVRLVTDQTGAVVSRQDYYPFGEQIPAGTNGRGVVSVDYSESPNLRQRFTGKERDGESELDYFGARYYSGAQGRFTTPDLPFADQQKEDPQSWNLYSYVRNNPLKYIDPNGRELRLAVFNSSSLKPEQVAIVMGMVREKFEGAGVLNVTVEPRGEGMSTVDNILGFTGLLLSHTRVVDLRPDREPASRLLGERIDDTEVGHAQGRIAAVSVGDMPSVADETSDQTLTAIANLVTHELGHTLLGLAHEDERTAVQSVMRDAGVAHQDWRYSKRLVWTPEQIRRLRAILNRPGEVDDNEPLPGR
jgi:RHS repeat-associated protein